MVCKISVIVPCYNQEKYIKECLDSLVSQTFKDYEVIVIDDGSTDDSAEIVNEYVKHNKNIRLIRQANQGVVVARNNAIKQAQGTYIYPLDADDVISPSCLEKLLTRRFNAGQSLSMLNDEFSTFIVGSDQVWRHDFIKNEKEAYFFSFANCEKKLISYAASFGVDTINATETEIDEYKMLMSLFDAISVREDSGINICQEMGVRATKVCDPVFLLSQQKWGDLAEEGKVDGCEDDVVFYTINEELEEDILKFINDNKDVLKYKSVKNITWKTSVEEWLFRVKNCKFFVTDSFHGSCFAIIFNKPFVCVNTNTRTSTRMLSLFDMLGIKGRYFSTFDDVNMHNLLAKETDYQKVNRLLEEMRKKSEEFLIAAIESSVDNIEEKKAIKKRYDEYVYQNALKSKNKIYFRYLKYKLLSKFPFGKKRKKYKQKRKEWRIYYKQNKLILKSKGK